MATPRTDVEWSRLVQSLQRENVLLRDMLDKVTKHPSTPELIKQYAQGGLHSPNPLTSFVASVSQWGYPNHPGVAGPCEFKDGSKWNGFEWTRPPRDEERLMT